MPRVLRMRNPMKINKSVSKKRTIDGDNINLMEDDQIDRKVSNALKQFTDTRVTVPKYRTSLQKSQQYQEKQLLQKLQAEKQEQLSQLQGQEKLVDLWTTDISVQQQLQARSQTATEKYLFVQQKPLSTNQLHSSLSINPDKILQQQAIQSEAQLLKKDQIQQLYAQLLSAKQFSKEELSDISSTFFKLIGSDQIYQPAISQETEYMKQQLLNQILLYEQSNFQNTIFINHFQHQLENQILELELNIQQIQEQIQTGHCDYLQSGRKFQHKNLLNLVSNLDSSLPALQLQMNQLIERKSQLSNQLLQIQKQTSQQTDVGVVLSVRRLRNAQTTKPLIQERQESFQQRQMIDLPEKQATNSVQRTKESTSLGRKHEMSKEYKQYE